MAATGEHDVQDHERLPWLETADEDYRDGPSPLRLAAFVLLGVVAVAVLALGGYRLLHRDQPQGTGALIAAQEGDYKVKPDAPGGMKVEGEGDTAFATSEGKGSGNGTIDTSKMPEAPINGTLVAPGARPQSAAGAIPASGGKLTAPPPAIAAVKTDNAASRGAVVQLGAFPSEAAANAAWTSASRRFAYLAPLAKSVQPADVNGTKVYRLRVNTGSAGQAADLCGKLRVAGEACFVSAN